jgi:hypothetical protein
LVGPDRARRFAPAARGERGYSFWSMSICARGER